MVLGCLVTFLCAIFCSRFIKLTRAEIDDAQARLGIA